MDIKEFQLLFEKFSKPPLEREVWETPEYDAYINALQENEEFYHWTLKQKFSKAKFNYKDFCCMEMADKVCDSYDENNDIKYDEVDVVINHWKDGTFGIPIHDGGTSIIAIKFCPWCGSKLNSASS